MTAETDTNADRRRRSSGVSGGIFLISLGILIFTGWWWPGILVAIGLASGAELIFRGQTTKGIGSMVFFWGIALIVIIVRAINVPWSIVAPLILVGIGVIVLVKALYLHTE